MNLLEAGIVTQWKETYTNINIRGTRIKPTTSKQPLTLEDVIYVFEMLAYGLSMSTILILLEHISRVWFS